MRTLTQIKDSPITGELRRAFGEVMLRLHVVEQDDPVEIVMDFETFRTLNLQVPEYDRAQLPQQFSSETYSRDEHRVAAAVMGTATFLLGIIIGAFLL